MPDTHRFTIEIIEGVNNVALLGRSGVCLWSGPLEDLEGILRRHQEYTPTNEDWPEIPVLEPITRVLVEAPRVEDWD